jgi:hypothetical protein
MFDVLNAATGTLKHFAQNSFALGKRQGGPALPCGRNCANPSMSRAAGKKDSGMSNGPNVNFVVLIGALLVIVLTAVAAVTLVPKMTLI